MPITLTVAGSKVKFENAVIEAAFTVAIAESPADRGVTCTLANAPIGKIAAAAGLGEDRYTGVGNATRRHYPHAIIARVEAILGCDPLTSNINDPVAEAALESQIADLQARLDAEAQLQASKMARYQAPEIERRNAWAAEVARMDREFRGRCEADPEYADSFRPAADLDSLGQLEESARMIARREDSREQG